MTIGQTRQLAANNAVDRDTAIKRLRDVIAYLKGLDLQPDPTKETAMADRDFLKDLHERIQGIEGLLT